MAKGNIVVSGIDEVQRIIQRVHDWADGGYQITMKNASDILASKVRTDMRSGLAAEGIPMAPLKQSTLDAPVRRDNNSARRGDYGDTPLRASGVLMDSIAAVKVSDNEYQVTSITADGQMKLASNVKTKHNGLPFVGDTPKPVRDPLMVTEDRVDVIFNQIVADIEKAIGT